MKRHHEYEPAPVDLRHPVDEEIIGEVTFMDTEGRFENQICGYPHSGRRPVDLHELSGGRKKPHGKAAHKAHVLYRETGMWVR